MITFTPVNGCNEGQVSRAVGILDTMATEEWKVPVAEQFQKTYAHGGGWMPFDGFIFDPEELTLSYPGDPVMPAIAKAQVNDETILVFSHAWVAIVQSDGSYEVARMD